MLDDAKKCKGTTKRGKPCNKYPLAGEEYCDNHHPTKILQRRLLNSVILNIGFCVSLLFSLSLFLCGRYNNRVSENSIKEVFKENSLAERILKNQYNPSKLIDNFREIVNLMNNDPNYKKTFIIDNKGIGIETEQLLYGTDFKIDFTGGASDSFQVFVKGGKKSITLEAKDYKYYYTLKDGNAIDSFNNSTFTISRNFPTFPLVNISTIYPTGEYLCTNLLNIQIDSIPGHIMYMSNIEQNNTFKIMLQYDYEKDIVSFDQLNDIYFDYKSPFYSINEEISYYEFLEALYSNACILIRNAVTGDTIKITEPYLPFNMSSDNIMVIKNNLGILRSLRDIQNRWRVIFNESNINENELAYINAMRQSNYTCSEIAEYPFEISLPNNYGDGIIDDKSSFGKSPHKIICNNNAVYILGKQLQLGRLVIEIPPSLLNARHNGDKIIIAFTPIDKNENILFEFVDLRDTPNPGNIIYGNYSPLSSDPSIYFVKGIQIEPKSWHNIKAHNDRLKYSEF